MGDFLDLDYVYGELRHLMREIMLLPEVLMDYTVNFFEGLAKGRYSPSRYLTVTGLYTSIGSYLSWFWERLTRYTDVFRQALNETCMGLEPWQVAAYTFGFTCFVVWLQAIFRSDQPLTQRVKKFVFHRIRRLPWVRAKIEAEVAKARDEIESMIHEGDPTKKFFKRLPEEGLTSEKLEEQMNLYADMGHFDWKNGKVSGAVYGGKSEETEEILCKVFKKFMWTNPLHPDVFPGVRKMEAEIVRMVANMFNGSPYACGTVTTGGTESLLLTCLAYRNRAYSMGITEPEIVVGVSAHAAFDKAGELLRVQITHVPVNPKTLAVDVNKMKRAINSNTVLLVGSAPSFPHGIVDPISEISELGLKYKIPVHVDACLGGFIVPFTEQAGFPLPVVDFRLPGVASISCDTHKYGLAPKGTSTVIYRSPELLRFQYFCQPDWPGGIYVTPTLAGSRSGVNIAMCWATLLSSGRRSYVEQTKSILETAKKIKQGIENIEPLVVLGDPQLSVVAFTSYKLNIYAVADMMTKKGFNLNALQMPASIHVCVTPNHTVPGAADSFLESLKEVVDELEANPVAPTKGVSAIYGVAQTVPDRSLISEFAFMFLDACYSTNPPRND